MNCSVGEEFEPLLAGGRGLINKMLNMFEFIQIKLQHLLHIHQFMMKLSEISLQNTEKSRGRQTCYQNFMIFRNFVHVLKKI